MSKHESIVKKKARTIKELQTFGEKIYSQIDDREFPSIVLQSRSIDNIVYEPKTRQYILGNRKIRRNARNIRHLRPFAQLVWTAWFAKELLKLRKTSTLREVYYSARGQRDIEFKDQDESDNIITDLETVLKSPREDFHLFSEERSAIFGDLTIEYTVPGYEGRRLNLTSHPDGVMIGPAVTSSELIETSAEVVLVIEKGAMFTRLVEEKAYEKFNALLIHTAGQAPRATRSLLYRLNKEMGLPIYIFSVDGGETILVEKDGLLRTVRIGEFVDNLMVDDPEILTILGPTEPKVIERQRVSGVNSLAVTPKGDSVLGEVSSVSRHGISEPLYKLVTKGGYSVCVTGSHSVMVYNSYSLFPKNVSELKPGDMLALCLNIPCREHLIELKLPELILSEDPSTAVNIWVVGGDCRQLMCRYKDDPKLWRQIRRNAVPLEQFIKRGMTPRDGMLRWGKSEIMFPMKIRVTPEFCRLLGYYASEGCVLKRQSCIQLSFGRHEEEYIKDAISCIKKVFGCPVRRYDVRSESLLRFGGALLSRLFRNVFRMGDDAGTKEAPYIIFNISKEMKIEFLKGYYRGDRRVKFNDLNHELQASTVSRKLASDLVLLLAQLGIVALVEETEAGKPHIIRESSQMVRPRRPYYVVTVRDRASLIKLRDIIVELCGERADLYINKEVKKSPIWYSIPVELIFPLRDSMRKEIKEGFGEKLETFLQHEIYSYKRISFRKLEEILDKLDGTSGDPRLDFVRKIIRNRVMLLPLVRIERVKPTSEYAYDIEVAGVHTFVGGLGPFVLHNTDGDPWGIHIAMVIVSGSANAAHLRDLTTPDAKWIGLWATDILKYNLPTENLTDLDIKRLKELQRDPRYEDEFWQNELKTFLSMRKKAEQEAFSRYGLTYIVDKYLPDKLETA